LPESSAQDSALRSYNRGHEEAVARDDDYAANQYLASRGFLVLAVNYRLGIGYGHAFHFPERGGARGASEYLDVLAAGRYLQSRDDVDAKRLGIWGGSYGGYLTALALGRNSDMFAAGVPATQP
jgi:dipeptidyl aminopeptidase/acylaminoacyl peptidase